MVRSLLAVLLSLVLVPSSPAQDATVGWRGNWTGLWPDYKGPLEWHRLARGIMDGLRARADRPTGKAEADASQVENGLIRDWLVLGPIPVANSVKDFDKAQLDRETTVEPSARDKVAALVWKKLTVPQDDPMNFGAVHMPAVDLATALGGYKPNQVGYAHTYLFAARAGTVRAVVDHAHGMAAWLNGKLVYRSTERGMVLGNYINLSRMELEHSDAASPRFDLELRVGWNRLLVKIGAHDRPGWQEMRFAMRLMDLPDVAYDTKNMVWTTELPQRSNATPIVVGDRLFVMAEPDELICLDKKTGRVLWSAANNYYEALTPEERRANPAFAEKVDPLVAQLKKEKGPIGRVRLRKKAQDALKAIDAERFAPKADGHFEAHFGIVGFTTPTPVSDGKHVWVWCGNGVAACYDLNGTRKWITRIDAGQPTYASSPALIDGTFAVFLNKLFGLDAATGKVRWEQSVGGNNGSLLGARIAGVPVVITQHGVVVRAADGKVLLRDRNRGLGDTGWSPGVVFGDVLYLHNYGLTQLNVVNFSAVKGEAWKPKVTTIHMPEEISRKPDGKWIDRMTAGSPLVLDGLAYNADIWASFYAVDLAAGKMIYRQETGLRGLFHYNALPVAASPALLGKHIVIQDNQGTALVLRQGRKYEAISRNRIATQLDRPWPVPPQETISYAPPIADGDRLYLRGERYLYCIGASGAGDGR